MAGDRVFNFNGANVTFNDIHDNHHCTIIVPKGKELPDDFCTYIVPNAPKSREEIEDDLVRGATKSAKVFANLLMRYEKLGYLDFRGEPTSDIYEYLQKRYNLNYDLDNFRHVFKPSVK